MNRMQSPEAEIEVNLLKYGWKNSRNHIKWTYFWRVPAIWNHCVAWAGLSRYLVCKVTALEALTSALKPRESRREFEHQKSRQIAVCTPLWSELSIFVQKLWGLRFILNAWNMIQYANKGHFVVGINIWICRKVLYIWIRFVLILKEEKPYNFWTNCETSGHSATPSLLSHHYYTKLQSSLGTCIVN